MLGGNLAGASKPAYDPCNNILCFEQFTPRFDSNGHQHCAQQRPIPILTKPPTSIHHSFAQLQSRLTISSLLSINVARRLTRNSYLSFTVRLSEPFSTSESFSTFKAYCPQCQSSSLHPKPPIELSVHCVVKALASNPQSLNTRISPAMLKIKPPL